nr:myb/SANT-like domain-containing protein [Tanacetum cinerariifolium]
MDQDTSSEIPNVNHENVDVNLENEPIDINDDTEPIQVWNHYSQRLDAKENDFYSSLMRDVGQEVPTDETKREELGGTKLFQEFMAKQKEKQDRVIKILESNVFSVIKDDPYSVSKCMSVINGMVDGELMMDDSPLLYLAMDLFEDAVKRELFMTMRNN